jgi:hypothetical protein
MHIAMRDGAPFAFAGVAERWLGPDGEPLDTCAIVTTEANGLLAAVHERMPVIVAPADYARWLDPTIADPGDLIAPYDADAMRYVPVSTRVNAVRHDDAALIEPVAPAEEKVAAEESPVQAAARPRRRRSSRRSFDRALKRRAEHDGVGPEPSGT